MPIHRRRITDKGVRPLISSEIKREYEYLFGMIEPLSGKDFMLQLPGLDTDMMQLFMDEFAKVGETSLHLILADNASAHRGGKVESRSKHRVHIFTGACTGTKSDREILERIERLALRL